MTDYGRGDGERSLKLHPTSFIWDTSFIKLLPPFFLTLKSQLLNSFLFEAVFKNGSRITARKQPNNQAN